MLKTFLGAASGLTLALASATALAQTQAPAAATAPVDVDPPLWVVKDADTTIYLFGTIHVLKPGLSWFDDAVKTAFDQSGELVLELADPAGPETMAAMAKHGTLADGPTLSDRLTPEQRKTYHTALAKAGAAPAMFDRQKPWMAGLVLSILPLVKDGYDPTAGPEMVLLPAARAAGKPVIGLETAEEQLGMLGNMPEKEQIEGLVMAAEHVDEIAPKMNQMLSAWSKGDEKGIVAFIEDSPGVTPEMKKAMFGDRNAKWAKWIEQRMAKPGTVFMAVGAGHLVGADSVQTKLAPYKIVATRVAY